MHCKKRRGLFRVVAVARAPRFSVDISAYQFWAGYISGTVLFEFSTGAAVNLLHDRDTKWAQSFRAIIASGQCRTADAAHMQPELERLKGPVLHRDREATRYKSIIVFAGIASGDLGAFPRSTRRCSQVSSRSGVLGIST